MILTTDGAQKRCPGREEQHGKKTGIMAAEHYFFKSADRVCKRPAVIFGSDGVEGCARSIFEIVSTPSTRPAAAHAVTPST